MDDNSGKDFRHLFAITRAQKRAILASMAVQSWEDRQQARMKLAYPGWDIWYIRYTGVRLTTWCAKPKPAPVAIFHASSPDELALKIDTALAS